MAHHQSAIKRIRQNKVRNLRNKSKRTIVRNHIKSVREALTDKDLTAAQEAYTQMVPILDKMANQKIVAKNMVSRTKSRLNKQIYALVQESK